VRYADPTRCPACRGTIGGVDRCTSCGFDLASPAARQLWGLFTQADSIVSAERTRSIAAAATGAEPAPTLTNATTPPVVPQTNQPPAHHASFALSPGAILLGLGALSLIVAATIFVSLTWGSLGIGGRALILGTLTVAFAAGLYFSVKHRLPATSETLAVLVFAMMSINIAAAHYENLLFFQYFDANDTTLLWGVVMLLLNVACQRLSSRGIGRNLYSGEIITGFASVVTAIGVTSTLWEFESTKLAWALGVGLLVMAPFLVLSHLTNQRIMWWLTLGFSGLWTVMYTPITWSMLADAHTNIRFVHIAPTLTYALVAAGGAFIFTKTRAWWASYAVLTAAFTISMLVNEAAYSTLSMNDSTPYVLALGVVLAVSVGAQVWLSASRPVLVWLNLGLVAIALVTFGGFALSTLSTASELLENTTPVDTATAIALVVVAASLLGFGFAWRLFERDQEFALETDWLWSVLAGFTTFALTPILTLLGASPVIAFGVAALGVIPIVWLGLPHSWGIFAALVPAWVSVAFVPGTLSEQLIVTAGIGLALAVAAWLVESRSSSEAFSAPHLRPWYSLPFAASSTAFLICAITDLPAVFHADRAYVDAYTIALCAGTFVSSMLLAQLRGLRIGIEIAAWTLALSTLAFISVDTREFVIGALILAAASAIVAVADRSRRWLLVGSVLLTLTAWFAQAAMWELAAVEWYSLPIAAFVLAGGLYAMFVEPEVRSLIALGPGLFIGFIMSVPEVVTEPASLRALLFGLAALVCLGVGLVLRWLAPVVVGSIALFIVIAVNVGPFIADLDRWVVFGALGALLLGVGIRWEQNVTTGKVLLTRLMQLR